MDIKLKPFGKSDFDRFISWIGDEEILVTIAGLDFTFPLDVVQLSDYLDEPKSLPFNVVVNDDEVIGHAEIIRLDDDKCLLDKVLIGDENQRGKGIGEQLMRVLLDYAFNEMGVKVVELSVYDWNIAGIRCYEKVGFKKIIGNEKATEFGNRRWEYFKMSLGKETWIKESK